MWTTAVSSAFSHARGLALAITLSGGAKAGTLVPSIGLSTPPGGVAPTSGSGSVGALAFSC